MITTMLYLIGIFAAYLLGSIPFGFIAGKMNGIDIRTVGSGNIGATNVFRTIGKKWGIAVFIMDFIKGFVSVIFIPFIIANIVNNYLPYLDLLCAVAAVAGHTWTIFLHFKGGKGVATGVGALMGLAPLVAATAFAIWIIVFLVSRYVSLASIIAALTAAISTWWYYPDQPYHSVIINLLATLIIAKHHSNIKRLVNGKENRFNFKKKEK